MFKSPQVRRWASATWCPSPWTTGCGECHRWSVAWSIDSYDPPYIEHWDLAIKHWDGCLMHQILGVHGFTIIGLNSCWLMMNNSLGISWDIVTIVGCKTSNIRQMSALFSAEQIDETNRTCRPVSPWLVSQKTGTCWSSCWKRGSHEDSEDAFFYPRWIELMLDEVAVSQGTGWWSIMIPNFHRLFQPRIYWPGDLKLAISGRSASPRVLRMTPEISSRMCISYCISIYIYIYI